MPEQIESTKDYVERIVSQWPPLTEAQRQRLTQLLSNPGRGCPGERRAT